MFSFLGQVIPDLLKTETTISNLLSFTLHALSFLSQLDPDHLKNSIDEETIDKGYNGVFQLFGGGYVKIMFSGFQNYFQTLTKEEQVPMFRLMSCHVIYCTVISPIVQFKSTENSNIGHNQLTSRSRCY